MCVNVPSGWLLITLRKHHLWEHWIWSNQHVKLMGWSPSTWSGHNDLYILDINDPPRSLWPLNLISPANMVNASQEWCFRDGSGIVRKVFHDNFATKIGDVSIRFSTSLVRHRFSRHRNIQWHNPNPWCVKWWSRRETKYPGPPRWHWSPAAPGTEESEE